MTAPGLSSVPPIPYDTIFVVAQIRYIFYTPLILFCFSSDDYARAERKMTEQDMMSTDTEGVTPASQQVRMAKTKRSPRIKNLNARRVLDYGSPSTSRLRPNAYECEY